jgi:hypothetical protein
MILGGLIKKAFRGKSDHEFKSRHIKQSLSLNLISGIPSSAISAIEFLTWMSDG